MKTIHAPNNPRWMRAVPFFVRVGLSCLLALSLGACGDDTPSDPGGQTTPPSIQSVDTTVVSPGDTLTIGGDNFATPASSNRVTFNNSLAVAVPYSASATSMSVVVPANAATGSMTVTSSGLISEPVLMEVVRGVGDVWTMSGTGLPYTFKLPNPGGAARYLVAPYSATITSGTFGYAVTPGESSVYPLQRDAFSRADRGTETFAYQFEQHIRQEAFEYIDTYGAGRRISLNKAPALAAPKTTTFYVLNTVTGSTNLASSYSTITADLRYTGAHTLIYSDIDNYAGANGFDQADYDELGDQFDTSTHPTDVGAFGAETDIDGNGKVVILFTRVVNSLTPDPLGGFISGFFLLNDLGPGIFPAGTTNGMEIFYTLVPDNTGNWAQMTKAMAKIIAAETLAHEFQHMISFGYRFVTLPNGTDGRYMQHTWLEEGMSHIAEDLNSMPDGNIGRADSYLADSCAVSLMLNSATLQQRGGIFLFLRYLGDHYGNTMFKSILRSTCVGTSCIENITAKNFFSNVGDFFAALYLSGSAVPHDSKYDYTSINYPGDFATLPVTIRSVAQGQFSGTVMNAAADYYIIEDINDSALTLSVSSGSSATVRYLITRIE
ncbi:MAG: IPT/TIG domain-containing protein [Candidatus Latescibacterota bacterium]